MPITAAPAPATSERGPVPSDAVSGVASEADAIEDPPLGDGAKSDAASDAAVGDATSAASIPAGSACGVLGRSEASLVPMGGSVVVMVPAVSGRRSSPPSRSSCIVHSRWGSSRDPGDDGPSARPRRRAGRRSADIR